MSATNVPQNLQATTGPGTSDGYLPFADVSGYVKGARAWLNDPLGGSKVECFLSVVDIPGKRVGVTFVSSLPDNYGRSDVSSYPVLSTLAQESPGLSNEPSRVDNKSDQAPLSISPRAATTSGSTVTFTANQDVTWLLASPALGSINAVTGVYTPGAAGTDIVIASLNLYPWIKAYATVTKTALFSALSGAVVPTSVIGAGTLTAETGQSFVCGRTTSAYVTLADGSLSMLRPARVRVEVPGIYVELAAANVGLSTQQVGNADWAKITSGAGLPVAVLNSLDVAAPDMTFTASKVSFPITGNGQYSLLGQESLGALGQASVYLRAPAGQSFQILLADSGENNTSVCNLTDQWQRFNIPVNAAAGGQFFVGYIDGPALGQPVQLLTSVPRDIYAWGFMAESTNIPTSYFPVGTQLFLGSDKLDTGWGPIISGVGSWTTGTVAGPDGTANIGGTFVMNVPNFAYAVLRQTLSVTAGQPYSISVWAKGAVGGELLYANMFDGTVDNAGVGHTLTTSWQRYTWTNIPANSGAGFVDLGCNSANGGGSPNPPCGSQTIYLAQAQLAPGNQVPAYFASGTSIPTTRGADLITISNPLASGTPTTWRIGMAAQPLVSWFAAFQAASSSLEFATAAQFVTAANSWSVSTVNVGSGNIQMVTWDNADAERAVINSAFPWPGTTGHSPLPVSFLAQDVAGLPSITPGGPGTIVGGGTGIITTQWGTVTLGDNFYGWLRAILIDNT